MPDIQVPPWLQALSESFPQLAPAPMHLLGHLPAPRLQRLATGQLLFAQGQTPRAFYRLSEGRLALHFGQADGRASSLAKLQAPALLGLSAFVLKRPSSYEAEALEASRVWAIGQVQYEALMDLWPGFARALLAEFARHFDGNLQLLQAARHQSAGERLELALLQLTQERGAVCDAQGWYRLCVTQQELASLAQLSRQTVNQLLGHMHRRGRLTAAYGELRWRPD